MKHLKVIGAAAVVFILFIAAVPRNDKYFEIIRNLDIFASLYKEVNAYYVDELNPTQLMETGIEAMLKSLDPYTNYISEENIEQYRISSTGEYAGIGALVGDMNGKTTILFPYEGYAADRAGLKIGDVVVGINGIDITGYTYPQASQLLKGQTKSEVTLTIKRLDKTEPFDVSLTREKIILKNVPFYGMVTGDIGYIQLTDFTTKAGAEVRSAVIELKDQGARKIILDLRGNPGGLLNEAVNICNVFIPQGIEVVTTRGKMEKWTERYTSLNLPTDIDIPLAVLVNTGSASASEIVSGVMQDYDRGVLIGRKTFGKGLVQLTRPLSYNSQLKVTTAKYYIPSGRCIQAIDYSHRNPDGSVGNIPDSLISEFKTANGRSVFDGGGVDPDIPIERKDRAPVTRALLSQGLIFEFATEFFYSHAEISSPKSFRLSTAEYANFKTWLSGKKFVYQTPLEEKLGELVEMSEKSVKNFDAEIKNLKKAIAASKSKDLDIYSKEIIPLLETEIATRYYLERGAIESTFEKDPDILTAIEVLNDGSRYQKLLGK